MDDLEKHFKVGETVTPEEVVNRGILSDLKDGLKVLAFGDLSIKLKVSAHKFSKAAEEKITKAGGEVTTL